MPFLIVVCLSRLARHLVGMLGGVQHGSQEHRLENHTGPNPRGKCLGFSKLLDTGGRESTAQGCLAGARLIKSPCSRLATPPNSLV